MRGSFPRWFSLSCCVQEGKRVPKGKGKRVLVTGGNGFLGSQVVLSLLERGYQIRATVRSKEKAEKWESRHRSLRGDVDWRVVPSFSSPAFADALQSTDIVAHTASPVDYNVTGEDAVRPAISGVLAVLRAAAAAKSVERVIYTSSAVAVVDGTGIRKAGAQYDEEDWSTAMYEDAIRTKSGVQAYQGAKILAEQAAWRFMREEKPGFGLTTLCPPMIYGPPTQALGSMDDLNTSLRDLWSLVNAKQLPMGTPYPIMCDVRDIAELHFLACTQPATVNQRYLTVAHPFTFKQMAAIIRSDPELTEEQRGRIVDHPEERVREYATVQSEKVVRDTGMKWRSIQSTVRDTMRELFRLEAELKRG